MDTDALLTEITVFADTAHGNQMRKYTPERYIVHPVRVMRTCKDYTQDIAVLAAALLHDVLEDTPVTKEELKAFLLQRMTGEEAIKTVQLVEELTDVYIKENYPTWNRKKRKRKEAERLEKVSAEAQTIKYADIIDNAPEITQKDPDFAKRFIPEYRALLHKITKGNPALYQKAQQVINNCMLQL
ncbi:HD domain-containing protein [Ilyomonas limi]|uniref:HD domain-containing protein n=2 Tax=Ilyomonas limi TaxID=2575867 RepID=A0A4U3L423_9BACT|nr:HD domain-containing protein [Ilyomonas limi]